MTKQEYIDAFVVQFVATHAANIYVDACMRGQHERLAELPFEDAAHLAQESWDEFNAARAAESTEADDSPTHVSTP